MTSTSRVAAIFLLVVFSCTSHIVAQTNLGGISGTVTDLNGAVIPNASVTITNVGTNRTLTLTTSDDGVYSATTLEPTFYRITIVAPNFKKTVVENLKVDTATTSTANAALEPGGVSDTTITVTAEAPILNTESGVAGQTITERQIRDLPVGNRSVLELATTVPNVTGGAGTEDPAVTVNVPAPGVNLNLNGGRPGETTILADGVTNTGVGLARQVVSFSPDVVQEFTVQTSAFSAEYGQTGGGVINTTTKSGTNDFRGTLYWYNRNPYFAAAPFTTQLVNRPRSELRQNNFGAIIGGPVYLPRFEQGGPRLYNGRNRTFFFFAFEPRYSSNSQPIDALLPTAAMRGGDFSNAVLVAGGATGVSTITNGLTTRDVAQRFGVPIVNDLVLHQQFDLAGSQFVRRPTAQYAQFPGNIIPASMLDPTAQRLLEYLPSAGDYFLTSAGQLRNYSSTRFVRINEKRYTVRFDHAITENNKINLRLTSTPILGVRGVGPKETSVNALGSDFSASKQILVGNTHVFSPTVVNDLRLNYTRGDYSRTNPPEFQTRNLSTELGLPSRTVGGLPAFRLASSTGLNIGQSNVAGGGNQLRDNIEETFNLADTLSLTRGNMNFKFGVDLRHQRQKLVDIGTYSGGDYEFSRVLTNSNGLTTGGIATGGNDFATFLLGVPSVVDLRSAVVPYYYRWNSANFFVQNDWKVRPNLTLNFGVRYSLQLPRTEKYDRQGTYLPLDEALTVPVTNTTIRSTATGNPVINLPAGILPSSTLVPVFAFAGRGGRSRYLTPVDKNDIEPRLGFAYTPKLWGLNGNGDRAFVLRGGYGLSHSVLTGQDRVPSSDLGGVVDEGFTFDGRRGINPDFALRLSSNPPNLVAREGVIDIPPDGLLGLGSIFLGGGRFVVAPISKVPSFHNWNLTLSYELLRNTVVEFAYVGSYSSNLFFPLYNINTQSFDATEALLNAGLNPDQAIQDPLGRRDSAGSLATFRLATISAPVLGFNTLATRYDASAGSIRHAGYVSLQRRINTGLAFTANYTYGKTINDASDNSGNSNTGVAATVTQVGYGGTREAERAVALYDIKHSFSGTFNYELPIGRGRAFLGGAPSVVNALIGGWQTSGVVRLRSGQPFQAYLGDANGLGSLNATSRVRTSLAPGGPLKNPRYDRSCPIGEGCEPYFNPAAFMRPERGQIGNSPRVIDQARWPGSTSFDMSLQKNFSVFGTDRARRLQLRADIFNVFNHPSLGFGNNMPTYSLVNSIPSDADISVTEFNNFVTANSNLNLARQVVGQTPNADYQRVLDITRGARGGATSGLLPANFYSVPLTEGFATSNVNTFNITTPEGLKLYRLRQTYNSSFGILNGAGGSRTIQFALKFYF
ncbi:MAG: carboxypeptidase regulatory-like domain-containing protein [Acidobacteriota bacterium]|nr:carboxypeptidase regulatory-like domain-containing protein [Acidobacteriota bacterium]